MKERLTTEDKVDLSLECVRFLHVTLTVLYIIVEIVVIYKKKIFIFIIQEEWLEVQIIVGVWIPSFKN